MQWKNVKIQCKISVGSSKKNFLGGLPRTFFMYILQEVNSPRVPMACEEFYLDGAVLNGGAPSSSQNILRHAETAMETCAIYIDGGYLDKVLQQDYDGIRIDMEKLVWVAARQDELLRAYYYHCMPWLSDPPTADEQGRFDSKRRFIDAISHIPRFQVRLGKLQFQGTAESGKPIFIRKRVDMMLGVDMMLLAVKHRVNRIVLLTGDSDAIPAVEAIKPEGVAVTLIHGPLKGRSSPSHELYKVVDERVDIDVAVIETIRR